MSSFPENEFNKTIKEKRVHKCKKLAREQWQINFLPDFFIFALRRHSIQL